MTAAAVQDLLTLAAARIAAARASVTPAQRERAKVCVMHYLTCALNGLDLPWCRAVAELSATPDGGSGATLIGTRSGVAAETAVFGNAVFGQSTLAEDVHPPSLAHPGSIVAPAALAAAEQVDASGAALLGAVVAGYDVLCGVGAALKTPEFTRRGFRPSGVFGPLGAAAAAAAVWRLDQDASASALAIAGNTSAGLREWAYAGSTDVYAHNGFAARNGFLATRLAAHGISGPASALTGAAGMDVAFAGGQADWEQLRRRLAGPGALPEISFKRFPACSALQTVLELAVAIRQRRQIDPRRIESATVFTHRHGKTNPGCDHPGSFAGIAQAQMSNQFGVALALSGRRPDLAGFGDYADPELTDLVRRVTVVEDPAYTRRYPGCSSARIEVTLVDGSAVAERLDDATPLSDEEVAVGFREALADRFEPSVAAELLSDVTRLESVRSVADLFAGFRGAGRRSARRALPRAARRWGGANGGTDL